MIAINKKAPAICAVVAKRSVTKSRAVAERSSVTARLVVSIFGVFVGCASAGRLFYIFVGILADNRAFSVFLGVFLYIYSSGPQRTKGLGSPCPLRTKRSSI